MRELRVAVDRLVKLSPPSSPSAGPGHGCHDLPIEEQRWSASEYPGYVERVGPSRAERGCLAIFLAPFVICGMGAVLVSVVNLLSPPITMTATIDGGPAGATTCGVRDWVGAEQGPSFTNDSANIRRQCVDEWWSTRHPQAGMVLVLLALAAIVVATGYFVSGRRARKRSGRPAPDPSGIA